MGNQALKDVLFERTLFCLFNNGAYFAPANSIKNCIVSRRNLTNENTKLPDKGLSVASAKADSVSTGWILVGIFFTFYRKLA